MNTPTSTATPERRSGSSATRSATTPAIDRHFAPTIGRMADCILDQLIRGEAADEAGLTQYGFLKSEIAAHKEAAMAKARAERPELFRMEVA